MTTISVRHPDQLACNSFYIPATVSASVGTILLNTLPWIHSFGTDNIFIGITTGNYTLGSANRCIGIGQGALTSITTSCANLTAVGVNALHNISGAGDCSAFGAEALFTITSGSNNALGYKALRLNTTSNNTAGGYQAGLILSTGTNNTLFGSSVTQFMTTANNNTVVGTSLNAVSTNSNNTAVGFNSLINATSGPNVCVGPSIGNNVISGLRNTLTGVGAGAGFNSNDNTLISGIAISPDLGGIAVNVILATGIVLGTFTVNGGLSFVKCVTIGKNSANIGTNFTNSVMLGTDVALGHGIGSVDCVYVGDGVGAFMTGESRNVLIGRAAGNSSGLNANNSVYVGALSGFNRGAAVTNCVGFGANCGFGLGGSNSTYYGANIGASAPSTNGNDFIIGAGATISVATTVPTFIIGNTGTSGGSARGNDIVIVNADTSSSITTNDNCIYVHNIGVAAENNTTRLGNTETSCRIPTIFGSTYSGGSGVAVFIDNTNKLGTTTSSIRYKDVIGPFNANSNNIISKLIIKDFTRKNDANKYIETGLIAEDVEQIYPKLVMYKDCPDISGNIVPIPETLYFDQIVFLLIKFYQENQIKINKLRETLSRNSAEISKLMLLI